METTTSTASATMERPSIEELARSIDKKALTEAANQMQTIDRIEENQKRLLEVLMNSGFVNEQEEVLLNRQLRGMQTERMENVHSNTSVVVANLEEGVAGQFDGKAITLDAETGITEAVYKHEKQHEEDGMPTAVELDEELVPETGIQEIDEVLAETGETARDILEDRATEAQDGVDESELYLRTHVATVNAVEERGSKVGVDMKKAGERLVKDSDLEGYRRDAIRTVLRDLAENDFEAFQEMAASVEQEARVQKDIRNIVAETRFLYEKGPERNPKEVLEAQFALAA